MAEDVVQSAEAATAAEIVKLKLDGVMMHVTLFENFISENMKGYACLHKHHAIEEFKDFLCLNKEYIKTYHSFVDVSSVKAPTIELDGATVQEKMEKGLSLYEDWEKQVLAKLKSWNASEEITCNVKKELKEIRRMWDDLDDGKAEELNEWLYKNYEGCY